MFFKAAIISSALIDPTVGNSAFQTFTVSLPYGEQKNKSQVILPLLILRSNWKVDLDFKYRKYSSMLIILPHDPYLYSLNNNQFKDQVREFGYMTRIF